MNATEKLDMQVAEELDGSAVVQLPPDEDNPQKSEQHDDDEPNNSSQNDDDGAGDHRNDDLDGIDSNDPNREAIRAARREERKLKKQLHREKARESNHLINALRKQNEDLAHRLAQVEQKTSGAELARLDKAIDDAGTRVEYAKMKLQEAVEQRNGGEVAKAQQLWYDSQRQLESLQHIKQNANRQFTQQKQNNIKAPDPIVQRNASDWMNRNSWYDPQLKDADSKIAQTIDQALTEEGYDPALPDYWDELDERLQKYLPHRVNSGYSTPTRNQRPKAVVTSSGRESNANPKANEFRLDPERVRAIKDAGMWDNIEQRNKMIRRFADYDRQQKRG